jgi:hypothetical protein
MVNLQDMDYSGTRPRTRGNIHHRGNLIPDKVPGHPNHRMEWNRGYMDNRNHMTVPCQNYALSPPCTDYLQSAASRCFRYLTTPVQSRGYNAPCIRVNQALVQLCPGD